ncbi:MAG: hypothetical protein MUF40_00110 [Gemmatimonadaceae bacterium]|jgi:hypothetical protein|nr:hypothetical protein [Gemmatimonadaceae bacterium]
MKDSQLAKMMRKAQQAANAKANKPKPKFDATLDVTKRPEPEDIAEANEIFKEMKRREF